MKNNWQTKKLGEVCEVLDKKRKPITQRDRIPGKYPYYGATGILDYVHEYIFDEKLILIGEDGAKWGSGENTAFIAEGKYWVNNHAHVIRPNRSKVLDNWIVYFLNFSDLSKYVTGLTVPKLNQAKMRDITFPLPPLPEQKRIVKVLDEVFEGVATAKENAEKNLANARELFESYLQSVFANPGAGWEEKTLGAIIKLEYGKPLPDEKRNPNGKYPVYGANGEKDRTNEYYHNKKSIIVGRKGSAGEINFSENKFWPLDVTYFVTFDDKKYDLNFIYYILDNLKLTKLAKGVKPGINRNEVYSIEVQIPSLSEQRAIVAKLDALSAETKKLEAIYQQKLADLDELKKSVLKKAFNGEL